MLLNIGDSTIITVHVISNSSVNIDIANYHCDNIVHFKITAISLTATVRHNSSWIIPYQEKEEIKTVTVDQLGT